MVNKQQYCKLIFERECMCVQSYLIWKEHYEWFDIYYRLRVIYSNFSISIVYILDYNGKRECYHSTYRHPCELYITNCFLISIYRSFCNLPSLQSMLGIRTVDLAIFFLYILRQYDVFWSLFLTLSKLLLKTRFRSKIRLSLSHL